MMSSSRLLLSAVCVVCVGMAACGSENLDGAVDDTVLEPSREQRIATISVQACQRYETCNGYGPGRTYTTQDACQTDYTRRAQDLWPERDCTRGRMSSGSFQECLVDVKAQACTGNFWDAVEAHQSCKRERVCSDAGY